MSLYGPKIRMPKVDMPNPGNPSWNLEKEKKIAIFIAAAIIIVIIAVFAVPYLLNGASGIIGNIGEANGVSLSWNNNPLDLKKNPTEYATLTIEFTNTGKFEKTINFEIMNPYPELLDVCSADKLETMLPGDKRTVNCLFRRNGEIFTGTYSIEVASNVGNAKTKLEIIAK